MAEYSSPSPISPPHPSIPGSTSVDSTSEVKVSHVQLFAIPWTIQSMEFSRPEYWSGQPIPSPGDLPNPGIKPGSPALQADSLPTINYNKNSQIISQKYF